MSTLQITFSNSIERLMTRFLAIMQQPVLDDVLAPEYVLIDNAVLGQWLNLQLAEQQGIAANIRYIQPSAFFWDLARALLPGNVPRQSPFAKDNMTWQLMSILQDDALLNQDALKPVKEYLQNGVGQLKHYQLAKRIADLFDQYLIYRPDWIQQWAAGNTIQWKAATHNKVSAMEAWQKILWQQILHRSEFPEWQRAEVLDNILRRLKQSQPLHLPMQRLVVVGISTLPPSIVEILTQLGKHIDVQLLVLNPCQDFWFDIKTAKTWAKSSLSGSNRKRFDINDDEMLIGNPLLAANGQEVREFIESLIEREGEHLYIEEDYIEPQEDSLLHSIQRDILAMVYAGNEPATMNPIDHSHPLEKTRLPTKLNVQFHICHGPMREVEVLHDQLLHLLSQDPTLQARDIVVMMPDTALFVPYIETVFSASKDKLPYQITDKTWLEDSPILFSIEALLGLPGSYFGLSEIIALLEVEAIRERFGIDDVAYESLTVWLQATGARWGIDDQHRASFGLPKYSEYSWSFAWHRLMAGYAMPSFDQGGELYDVHDSEIDPFDAIEGSNTEILNGFYVFWQTLLSYKKQLSASLTLLEWSLLLQKMLDDFLLPNEADAHALKMLRVECEKLKQFESHCQQLIDITVIRDWIKPLLTQPSKKGNPWQEGVKFCSLMPMRAVPFRVVYLMGMNQSDYPKQVDKPLFDLMRYDYRGGDRSRRVGDRWLFLEALLSARDAFYISYTGKDARNNDEKNPSVLVSELIDYIDRAYSFESGKSCRSLYVNEHPLQPFSKEYFTQNGNRISYNAQAFAIASSVAGAADNASTQTIQTELSSSTEITLSIQQFVNFFTDPSGWFFKQKHAVWLNIDQTIISDDEVFEVEGGLGAWKLRDAMRLQVEASSENKEDLCEVLGKVEALWKSQALWPLGKAGEAIKEKIHKEVKPDWLYAIKRMNALKTLHTLDYCIQTDYGQCRINDSIMLHGDIHCIHSSSKQKDKSGVELAIKAALLALALKPGLEVKEICFDASLKAGKRERVYPVKESAQHEILLTTLAGLYFQYQHTKLPFDYDVAKSPSKEKIHDLWEGGFNDGGMRQDASQRFYYHSLDHIQSSAFTDVGMKINKALGEWMADNLADLDADKKANKKVKESKNVV